MKAIIKRAHRRVHEMQLEEFLFSHPAQVALLGLQFQWTADTQVGGLVVVVVAASELLIHCCCLSCG